MTLPLPAAGPAPTAIAVVLPQFHPTPENDAWWGKGFTEWTNVAKARPQFPGHHQPHLPGELGFYDLRLPEARAAQAALAREHGIGGFCYYHYWFNGKQLLHKPVDAIVASGEPDFPFCICWANENWSRAWNGSDREILMKQDYSAADDEAHIQALLPVLADPRYIRVDGRPLLIVYKVHELPEPQRTFERWRAAAMRAGLGELCLAQFESGGSGTAVDPRSLGLDLSIEFTPDWRRLGGQYYTTRKARIAMQLGLLHKGYRQHRVCDYRLMVEQTMAKPAPDYPFLRCVSPGFDNSPRRQTGATILIHNEPAAYENWLERALAWTATHAQPQHRIVFLNAWNEWAEGNHLEPDARHGRSYLEATRRALSAAATRNAR